MALETDDLKQIATLIADAQAASLKPLLARLEKMDKVDSPDIAALVAKAMKDAKPEEKKEESKMDPAIKAKLAAMESQLAAQKEATVAADTSRKEEKMLSALRTQLIAQKVPATRVDHVIAVLHHQQGRVGIDEAGQATLRFDRTSTGGSYTDTPALKKGLEEWLGTDAGKAFLPATRVQGSEVHGNQTRPLKGVDGKVNPSSLINSLLGAAVNR